MSIVEDYERQIGQFSHELRERECALVALGRCHAAAFDDGHAPSGARVQHVLTELRKLAERRERLIAPTPAPVVEPERSQLDELRERRKRSAGP